MAKTRKPARKTSTKKETGKIDSISVRMYCHGFGDCFLLRFHIGKTPVYNMLIDCGMLTGDTETLKKAIENIKKDCGGKVDLVVQTHEHKDHISGFNLKDKAKKLLWDDIKIDTVWLAWTENTGVDGDDLAKKLKEKQDKKKKALVKALGIYDNQINKPSHRAIIEEEYYGGEYFAAQQRYSTALHQLLTFFDIDDQEVKNSLKLGEDQLVGLTMKDAMSYFIKRNKSNGSPDINFWNPGDMADEKITGLKGVRFYFLGPPKDYDKLRYMEDKEHEEMYMNKMGLSDNFFLALADNNNMDGTLHSPFQNKYSWNEPEFKENFEKLTKDLIDDEDVRKLYHDAKWRGIETDWLHNAGALALHLDSYTNNTSLVIAIELEDSGKVLLFAADAQIGNWISWTETNNENRSEPKLKWKVDKNGKQEIITAEQLLERTVFYKVGHHSSHNATARKHGLELMTSDELVAMIPVDEEVAKKQGKRGWKMPAEDLYKRLKQKTKGRIIRLDIGSLLKKGIHDLPQGAQPSTDQLKTFTNNIAVSDTIISTSSGKRPLYYEYKVIDQK